MYKIKDKYYVKVSGNFVEVELVYSANDVSLKPTNICLEDNGQLNVEEVNFKDIKESLLNEHKKQITRNMFDNGEIKRPKQTKYSSLK